jgi:hypothetical protein
MASDDDLFQNELPEGARPAVFMFQPHSFETVAPDRLAEWERGIQRDFGFSTAEFDHDALLNSASWSNCGDGEICADDSDYHEAVSPSYGEGGGGGEEGPAPTIFLHQPSRFAFVPSDRLSEWERLVRERVGLPISGCNRQEAANSATLSATLPNDCMDDSDYLSE